MSEAIYITIPAGLAVGKGGMFFFRRWMLRTPNRPAVGNKLPEWPRADDRLRAPDAHLRIRDLRRNLRFRLESSVPRRAAHPDGFNESSDGRLPLLCRVRLTPPEGWVVWDHVFSANRSRPGCCRGPTNYTRCLPEEPFEREGGGEGCSEVSEVGTGNEEKHMNNVAGL